VECLHEPPGLVVKDHGLGQGGWRAGPGTLSGDGRRAARERERARQHDRPDLFITRHDVRVEVVEVADPRAYDPRRIGRRDPCERHRSGLAEADHGSLRTGARDHHEHGEGGDTLSDKAPPH
jgi:hypothetical protein